MKALNMWDKIVKVSERATLLGSIEKIESTPIIINENGVNFVVSVAKSLLKRPFNYPKPNNTDNSCNISNENNNNNNSTNISTNSSNNNENNNNITPVPPPPTPIPATKKFIDPFLPCDKDLFVTELYDRHNLVLNKYNVSNYHSIIATKEFESQTDPLNEFDFKAIWKCIKECNMLCFFNCGPNSGASQPHKHVQLLTTPFVIDEPNLKCPMESLFVKYQDQYETIIQIDQLPFKTAAIYYDPKKVEQLEKLEFGNENDHSSSNNNSYQLSNYFKNQYKSLLDHLDLNNNENVKPINNIDQIINNQSNIMEEQCKLKSYNFIMTKDWMFIVPRKNYQSNGISINSVGFTGAVLVRKDEELETLKSKGIISILKDVSFPKP